MAALSSVWVVLVVLALLVMAAAHDGAFGVGLVRENLLAAAEEAQELIGSSCPRVRAPSPLEFARDFVHQNRPCVITGAMDDWPAMSKWSDDYLLEKLAGIEVSINVTPNGRGDAVARELVGEQEAKTEQGKGAASGAGREVFVMPEERTMPFHEFLSNLKRSREEGGDVFYLSHQNDNLREQLKGTLLGDVPPSVVVADEALGHGPDAVNLWMGDGNAVTTLHKDHYENLYGVVRGAKHFTLYPPSSAPFLYPTQLEARRYAKSDDGAWSMQPLPELEVAWEGVTRPWIAVDPARPDLDRFPLFEKAVPTRVTVRPGELLYLPAMWFHQVAQDADTVAVNYWYDMHFGASFALNSFVQKLALQLVRPSGVAAEREPGDESGAGVSLK